MILASNRNLWTVIDSTCGVIYLVFAERIRKQSEELLLCLDSSKKIDQVGQKAKDTGRSCNLNEERKTHTSPPPAGCCLPPNSTSSPLDISPKTLSIPSFHV
ncbi:hypothetical protein L6452_22606 [Arctium lappa]|uniref:Uncharacterized protein n=1 Tax=Arctium lappa TaxID=4217 RepID=A0ACB9B142_ARCLA|nr:hypothetical protein L6452_22606 [Arctium lappa]